MEKTEITTEFEKDPTALLPKSGVTTEPGMISKILARIKPREKDADGSPTKHMRIRVKKRKKT